jgi:hypothetical protein
MHFAGDPGSALPRPFLFGACRHDLAKVPINVNAVGMASNRLSQRSSDASASDGQDESGIWTVPEHRHALFVPGKNPLSISGEDVVGLKVATYGHQTAGVGVARIGKGLTWAEKCDGQGPTRLDAVRSEDNTSLRSA